MEHQHRFIALKGSVFGLKNIHLVGRCVFIVEKKQCSATLCKIVPVKDFQIVGDKKPKYYYTPDANNTSK